MQKSIKRSLNKVFPSSLSALSDFKSNSSLSIGGFGLCGIPENLIRTLSSLPLSDLTLYTTLSGTPTQGPGLLFAKQMVCHLHTSYIGANSTVESQYLNGELEITFNPMGTLIERLRSGSTGILGFYTRSGAGTVVETGGFPTKYVKGGKTVEKYSKPKEIKEHNGVRYLYEEAVKTDFAFVKAWKADPMGNLVFRKSARNSNADLPGSAKVTIAEVEEIVGIGELDPDNIHVPGVLVQRVVKGERFDKVIEFLTLQTGDKIKFPGTPEQAIVREKIAKRAAQEIKNGMIVNLGIGIPTLIPNFVHKEIDMILHSENGLIGIGPYPKQGLEDADLTNAGKETITMLPGASLFSGSTSFGIIRGGHLDLTCVGALQVSENGDFASWVVPGKLIKGMGGAMDLASSPTKLIVCMEHTSKTSPKILPSCTLPLTCNSKVSMLITDQAVFEFNSDGMILKEISPSSTLDHLASITKAKYSISSNLKTIQI